MTNIQRVPAIPLIANDPYFSIWSPGDILTDKDTVHWSGAKKYIRGQIKIDGKELRFLGKGNPAPMTTTSQKITPTRTIANFSDFGISLELTFWSTALPHDMDLLSTPITLVDFKLISEDDNSHEVELNLMVSTNLCYDGAMAKPLWINSFIKEDVNFIMAGQKQQNLLSHSADHITMDWGYLYLASSKMKLEGDENALLANWSGTIVPKKPSNLNLQLAYDDVASILYFGHPCKAWYARKGKTITSSILEFDANYNHLFDSCKNMDKEVMDEAFNIGDKEYQTIASIAWRHTFAAHKLISTPKGDPAWISKENDSNGCMCTVDVSYPSVPLFLKYQPELVNAMLRPVLEFASMPVWEEDFAPHDIGRYPIASGQVYAFRLAGGRLKAGEVSPPLYQYPPGLDLYDIRYQMPVEECGNMLIMLAALAEIANDASVAKEYQPILAKWVKYLEKYGEDPGEQLCTDDFAGHLAHNVNLSAKALVGIACYGRLLNHFGEDGSSYITKAKDLAQSWRKRASTGKGYTALTFKGKGWSQKYNLVWDIILDLGLLPESFYKEETDSYLNRINTYGLPLDSRKSYTKADWIIWSATMSRNKSTFKKLIAPLIKYLEETPTRVPYSDWYDTVTGAYEHFIARSVQGGMYMPMLLKDWVD